MHQVNEDLHTIYATLVQDTLLFLQTSVKKKFKLVLKKSPSLSQPSLTTTPPKEIIENPQPVKKISEKLEEKPEVMTPPPPSPLKVERAEKKEEFSAWELCPMPQCEQEDHFKYKLAKHIPIIEPYVAAYLVLPDEQAANRFFLENLSRAITRTLGPARVVTYYEGIFAQAKNTRFLVPASILKQKFPQAQPHQQIQLEHFQIIFLDNLDTYGNDLLAKRTLWNTIQLSFQSSLI